MNQNSLLKMFTVVVPLVFLGTTYVGFPASAQDFGTVTGSGSSGSTGSRGGCPTTPKPLMALVPTASAQGGLTIATHPTFWVYVPYALTPEKTIEFVLQDEQGSDVYKTRFQGAGTAPGIVSVALPPDTPALAVDQSYHWYFSVYCGSVSDRPSFVTGWVKRIALDPSLQKQAAQGSIQERSTLYAAKLLWYDALTTLGEGLRARPTDKPLATSWAKLLQLPSVGLNSFATEPLVSCCTPTKK